MSKKARYIMIGGFLGAGKTTAVSRLARHLSAAGLTVGLITNDQGSELVDTAMLRSIGFATEEIPGGCFCCRFNSLTDAARKLSDATSPDVFIAEPVGSCTDLVATVTYPLRRIYGQQYTIAPLSVLVDPIRAERIFGLAKGASFSEKVLYIYRKQLEEADIIVISKCDLLSPERLEALHQALATQFPAARILHASPREGHQLEDWFGLLSRDEQQNRKVMDVDYAVYAEGEALLGWLNATVAITAAEPFDPNVLLADLAADVQSRLGGSEIAHFKMTYSPDDGIGDIAAINVVRNDIVPELSLRLDGQSRGGQLIINLRAEAASATLSQAVTAAVAALSRPENGLVATLEHQEHFQPGKPTPTHRDV